MDGKVVLEARDGSCRSGYVCLYTYTVDEVNALWDDALAARVEKAGQVRFALLPQGYAYVNINKFTGGVETEQTLDRFLEDDSVPGLIIDVRDNPGGGISPYRVPNDCKPVVILIDSGTTSAAEQFAANFGVSEAHPNGHPSVLLIGQGTAGSTSFKRPVQVPSGLFSFWFSSSGRHGVINPGPGGVVEYYGVRPDVELLPEIGDLKRGEDTLLKRAVASLDERIRKGAKWPSDDRQALPPPEVGPDPDVSVRGTEGSFFSECFGAFEGVPIADEEAERAMALRPEQVGQVRALIAAHLQEREKTLWRKEVVDGGGRLVFLTAKVPEMNARKDLLETRLKELLSAEQFRRIQEHRRRRQGPTGPVLIDMLDDDRYLPFLAHEWDVVDE